MSSKLRFGIMSTAKIARNAMIPGILKSERCQVEAVASRDMNKAQELAERYHIDKYYGSYEELLQDPQIDAVYIPLPNHLHKDWSIKAAQAGKHILCEKPASLTEEDVQEMIDAVAANGVLFVEAFMYRYHPKHARVQEIIESGEIGELRGIHGSFTFNNAQDQHNVRYNKDMGGGSIYDVGCYPISAARMLFKQEPVAVTAHGFFSEEHDGVDMMVHGMMEFGGGLGLTFECGMWTYAKCSLEIAGTDGRIELPSAFGWERMEDMAQIFIHTAKGSREEKVGIYNHFALQADALAAAVMDGAALPYGPEDAIANIRAIEATLRAARSSSRIVIST
ncbi:Gfo/Idh/MocA family oxidoreductase [Paenibacillus sp. JCM 10914]|uniref:Gfo/Idh/MocA family protein n=1 Tax=Paenibacillus sp. JCM 10914 TaxID=1236974 RepID=UPI0003CCB770|nr:Gfo/Idh/MocA family oxidoreductase [Paenibacillus sp. JCM 10914]GAE04918.1 oxidoreductase [Paenibacillus sp. JCM 10914]